MICPIKAREFPVDGQSIECSSSCAWALKMVSGDLEDGFESSYRCAVAVAARALNDQVPENAFMVIPYFVKED